MPKARLERVLGIPLLTFYGVGLILGAGVYSILGEAAGAAGHTLWMAFVAAAFIALLTGLSYAELSTMYPRAAAEYVFAVRAFPNARAMASAMGFLLTIAGMATAATVAVAFAGYLRTFLDVPVLLAAGFVLLASGTVNAIGMRQSAWANVAMTLLEVGGLLLIVVLGIGRAEPDKVFAAPEIGGLAAATSLIFFAYLGFEGIANLAEEAKRPGRSTPAAILWSMGISTALYVLVAIAAVSLAAPDDLAESESPLALAVSQANEGLAPALAVVALAATANTALVSMLTASRILYGMGRGGDVPRPLARVWARRHTPVLAAAVVVLGAAAMMPFGGTDVLGSVASLYALAAFSLVNVCLVRLRYTEPKTKRPFRVPLAVGRWPVLPTLAIAGSLALMTQFTWDAYLIAAVGAVLSACLWVLQWRFGSKPPAKEAAHQFAAGAKE